MILLIADTSPLISLLLIGQFETLESLFPSICLPQAVWEELNSHNEIRMYKNELNRLSLKVRTVRYHFPISGIERGETEAIILCQELGADYLLIDDKKAREKAELLDIKSIGTLGVLFLGKQRGLISALRPLFQTLLNRKRYYAKKYINIFLEKSGEEAL